MMPEGESEWTVEKAREVLALQLPHAAVERREELVKRSLGGDLSEAERTELEHLREAQALIVELQAKARNWLDGH